LKSGSRVKGNDLRVKIKADGKAPNSCHLTRITTRLAARVRLDLVTKISYNAILFLGKAISAAIDFQKAYKSSLTIVTTGSP
jgi:hypothetical protein